MRETVLVTGASGGIGYDLSLLFAQSGYNLVLVARNGSQLLSIAQQLETQYNVHVRVMAQDLGVADAPRQIYQKLQNEGITIDILVNNAGFGLYGFFHELGDEEQQEMIDLNISAVTKLTRLVLPDMVSRRKGKILNIASTAAFQPGPLMAVYYATKAFVLSLSEALANELQGTGVTVTTLCPGPTNTGFESRANLGQSKLFNMGVMDSPTVARIGFDGMMRGKTLVIPGAKNKVLAFSTRFMPRKLITSVVRHIQGKK